MGATSLFPFFMSLALLSKTALDLTTWGNSYSIRSKTKTTENHNKQYGSEFATHQVREG